MSNYFIGDTWNNEKMKALYELKTKSKLTYREIKEKLNLPTIDCAKSKFNTTNWEIFFNGDETGWSDEEKSELYNLKNKQKLTFPQVAKKLNRTVKSVQHSYYDTDWDKFLKEYSPKKKQKEAIQTQEISDSAYIDNLVKGIIEVSRHDPDTLRNLTKNQFRSKIIINGSLPISFIELKKKALYELEQVGYSYPSIKNFSEGTYIIVGDTHGKHTRTGMFKLLNNLNNHLKADRIIHVGHFVDDDNDFNYNWEKFSNLTILAKEEELKLYPKKQICKDIVRQEIFLGEKLSISNQDIITDYVQTALTKGISPEFFEGSTICNLHRHEFDTRCTEKDIFSCIASPGCLCENHIVYTVKQQDFTDGRTVKQTFPTGYKKYRRMQHMYKTWQQGLIVVHVDKNGDFSIIMCRIRKTSGGYTTSYFDKIITETEVLNPDEKSFINSDLHTDYHDRNVLDIQEQIVKDYKPDIFTCLGDITENKAINHHEFAKFGSMRVEKKILKESSSTNYLLTKMSKWAKRRILLLGNHERFYQDLIDKLPQFAEILDFNFISGIQDLGIEVIDLKQMKKIANMNLTHGNMQMYGQKGGMFLDKLFRTYGRNTIVGHTHYPSCRFDCYTVGLSGKLNLEYNETNASKWTHSCILANSFEGTSFITNILIVNDKTILNKKCYKPINPENWTVPKYKVKMIYSFME